MRQTIEWRIAPLSISVTARVLGAALSLLAAAGAGRAEDTCPRAAANVMLLLRIDGICGHETRLTDAGAEEFHRQLKLRGSESYDCAVAAQKLYIEDVKVAFPAIAKMTSDGEPLASPEYCAAIGKTIQAKFPGVTLFEPRSKPSATKTMVPDSDPPFNAGRHYGTVAWAADHCPGHVDRKFTAAMASIFKSKAPDRFAKGVTYGEQEMQRVADKNGKDNACLTVDYLYGPRGRNFAGAWVPD